VSERERLGPAVSRVVDGRQLARDEGMRIRVLRVGSGVKVRGSERFLQTDVSSWPSCGISECAGIRRLVRVGGSEVRLGRGNERGQGIPQSELNGRRNGERSGSRQGALEEKGRTENSEIQVTAPPD
jgi:hypothetical protein